MTIKKLTIKNYQSHTNTELELGKFTVLVGPSNVGKSAITRAIKALASNQTGKDFITHGQQTAQISATTDKGTVVLTKGKPEDSYVILYNGDPNPHKYTKNGTTAPEDVTKFLGIDPKDAINFAGQFDMPYLLKTSATEVARTLGELTNVSSIFEASRESLRRKSAFSSTLKTRESDLAALQPRISQFENLTERINAATRAETYLNIATAAQKRISRLNDLLMTLQTATARLKAAQNATTAPLPDVQPALDLYARQQNLNALIGGLQAQTAAKREHESSLQRNDALVTELDAEYDALLHEAGTCPTCHQSTEGIHTHA
jgi:DNA repair ATPase RecN